VLDYERTLILAIELSNTSWVLAAQIPGLPGVKAKRSIEPTPEALMAAIEDYRTRAAKAGRNVERVVDLRGRMVRVLAGPVVGTIRHRDARHSTFQRPYRSSGASSQVRWD